VRVARGVIGPRALRPGAVFMLIALVAAPWAMAQSAAIGEPAGADAGHNASGAGTDLVAADTVSALASFGVQFGFPAYRTAALSAGLQARFVGVAVRVGGGPGGFALGLQARAYPPIPIPLPVYVAGGVDLYAGRVAPHVAVGAHVPLGGGWRIDVQAGAAWTPLLDEVRVVPLLGVGASYTIPLVLPAGGEGAAAATGATGGRIAVPACEPGPPDLAALDAALADTVRRFVADAVAAYGSVYRDLRYRTSVEERRVEGNRATLTIAYAGSVVEILTGRPVEASGEAEADFRWDGCRWRRTGLRY
jgi:hypothetical protein